MASSNSTSKSQQKEGEKKQRRRRQQQQPLPAKRRRDLREDEGEKKSKICEPKRKQIRVANDLAQPKTESDKISSEEYMAFHDHMIAMIHEVRNSVLMTLQRFHLEMKNVIQDYARTGRLQRPNSEDECVSICTSLSSIE